MSAQGGYDDLSAPQAASEEDDNIEQILLDMVDEGELELVWLEDQGEFGFYMPEPTGEELILPSQGAHAAPRPRRTVGLRRCAMLTVAAFVSPLIVGTAYATVVSGKPALPSIVPDIDPPQHPEGGHAVVAPDPAPTPTRTVPVVPQKAPRQPAAKPVVPHPSQTPGQSGSKNLKAVEERPGKHRRRFQWPDLGDGDRHDDGFDVGDDIGTGRHRLERDIQRLHDLVDHAPISPRDLLHHMLGRQLARTDSQVTEGGRSESGNTTDSGKRHRNTASDALDRNGIAERVLTTSSATPLGTKVVSAA